MKIFVLLSALLVGSICQAGDTIPEKHNLKQIKIIIRHDEYKNVVFFSLFGIRLERRVYSHSWYEEKYLYERISLGNE